MKANRDNRNETDMGRKSGSMVQSTKAIGLKTRRMGKVN